MAVSAQQQPSAKTKLVPSHPSRATAAPQFSWGQSRAFYDPMHKLEPVRQIALRSDCNADPAARDKRNRIEPMDDPVSERPLRGLGAAGLAVLALLLTCVAPGPSFARGSGHHRASKLPELSHAKARAERKAAKAVARAEAARRTEAAKKAATTGPSWTAGEREETACSKGRRKLWQPGEGWVVKRVNVCP